MFEVYCGKIKVVLTKYKNLRATESPSETFSVSLIPKDFQSDRCTVLGEAWAFVLNDLF